MKSFRVDFTRVADALQENCPFILFAILPGVDREQIPYFTGPLELSVYISPGTMTWHALESILVVISDTLPGIKCHVVMLNRADAATRFKAAQGKCLFFRDAGETYYHKFIRHASLDYRIFRARQRKIGIIWND